MFCRLLFEAILLGFAKMGGGAREVGGGMLCVVLFKKGGRKFG